jgi:hypothetical protein
MQTSETEITPQIAEDILATIISKLVPASGAREMVTHVGEVGEAVWTFLCFGSFVSDAILAFTHPWCLLDSSVVLPELELRLRADAEAVREIVPAGVNFIDDTGLRQCHCRVDFEKLGIDSWTKLIVIRATHAAHVTR